ncbi:EAL domain-containing protein [Sphingomonas sp. BN140010]|uniref:EAL domain-containing protein n=1 Tax=Sphingomonas arvum TaxID=2992113 RepID=A0ABT3JGF3_9SPHN|nr:EAL domain-containing protein [Sphingomonas sp. BN140010]MCW3798133.1 EAL domain-containing protein [Sphingomonas sp. BN140010]
MSSVSDPDKARRACEACKDGKAFPLPTRAAFQPILDLQEERVFAYEALIRGIDGQSAAFVLQQVGDEQVYSFDQACRVTAIRDAVAAGIIGTGAKLSINFMPNAVYSPKACIQLTLKTARENGFPQDRLIFEFTENEKLDVAHIRNIVAAYRELGFTTAIDDFGAGHAGLNLLADLQTDMVKVDMDLIRGIDRDSRRRAILESLVQLLRRLGTEIVAEGVETEEELAVLRLFGIRFVQGYLFGKPALGTLQPYPDRLRRGAVRRRHQPIDYRTAI